MQYHPIEEPVNLENGTMQSVKANGQKFLLANIDGNYYAIGQKWFMIGVVMAPTYILLGLGSIFLFANVGAILLHRRFGTVLCSWL